MKIVKDTVEVASTQVGYKFPTGHPTKIVKTKDGSSKTMYVIPVVYADPEDADYDVSEEYATAARKSGIEDITQAFKNGMRLAAGNAAKDAFAVEASGGAKGLVLAIKWIATSPFLPDWVALNASNATKADEFALTKWRER